MQGIWSGMIGGTLMQTLILIWVTFRTNWDKEVCCHVGPKDMFASFFFDKNSKFGDPVAKSKSVHVCPLVAGGRSPEKIKQVGSK
jgi:hypothetical protein